MSKPNLSYLGSCIRDARKRCDLTQQELAKQTGLAVKTIQDIENGRINPTYETLSRLIDRLGIPANSLFRIQTSGADERLQHFIWTFQSCSKENQEVLLRVLDSLTKSLLEIYSSSI